MAVHLRIFLSSPGDVAEERTLAREVIAELQRESQFQGARLEAVSWDDPHGRTPLVAQLDPQTAVERGLPKPSACAAVVGIFWARMGSPLPLDVYQKTDGSPFLSGTEYELEDAFGADPTPDVLLYRRSEEPRWGARDPEWAEKQEQLARLDGFLDSLKAAQRYIDTYPLPAELKERLKNDLRKVLARQLQAEPMIDPPPPPVVGPPTIWNVPHLRNPHFTGRDALLDALHRQLTGGRVTLTAVQGMGGVGKTQLAVEYAYRRARDFDLVWWLRAEEPATLLEDYAALALPLGLAEADGVELAVVAQAVCRELARRDRWLLVLDNADQPDDVKRLLPKVGNGRVLITSRNPAWPFASSLDVPPLSRLASVQFLLKKTRQGDETAADAVADELGDLPLGLEQAAAYLVETGLPLADYLKLFRTRRGELWNEEKAPTGYSATVGTVWTMAVDRLRTDEPRAVDLLNLCAFLAPEAIPRSLLNEHHEALPSELGDAVADSLGLNGLIKQLRRYSLVETKGKGFSCHRLIQAAAREALGLANSRPWVEAAVGLMCAGFPYNRDDPTTWAPSGALLTHALAAAGHAETIAKDLEATRRLLHQTARYFETRAEFEQARDGCSRALAHAEAALGPNAAEVATYVNNLGLVLQVQGDLAGAKAAFERALGIDEASFGPDDPNIARDVSNLGSVLRDLGDLSGAKAACERALKIDEASFGPDHPNVATYVNNLGLVRKDQGDLSGAKAAFERALKIDEASFGPDHPNVARDVNNLGSVLKDLGDLAGAKAALERALAIRERVLGPDHPSTRTVRGNLDSLGGG